MSMSIPLFFVPVRFSRPPEPKHNLVDGGMLSNFPIWMFDDSPNKIPEWPTFGFRLHSDPPSKPLSEQLPLPIPRDSSLGRFVDFADSMVETMIKAHDRFQVDQMSSHSRARTITIEAGSVSGTNFALSPDEKRDLVQRGRIATEQFLDSFSFEDYLLNFRS
jgi:NTE family protein